MSSKASEFQIAFNVFQNNTLDVNFGQKSLAYTAPTGFSALQQDNLPETAKGVSGLVWTKNRDATDNHQLYDSSRGKQLVLASNATTDETTVTDGLQKFLAGGQQIEDSDAINTSNESYVSWNWVANGGTTASNTDGSITSTVQANTTAGFSIIQWTGLGGGTGRTIGHGLSSAPEWIVVKNLTGSSGYNWNVYHIGTDASNPSDYFVSLNTTSARDNSVSTWNDTAPTSTVFSVNHEATAGALGNEMIAYCWHGVDGFSKFGKYTGNGSSDDGPFIYTGFRPAWLMYKGITEASQWDILDNKRNPFNPQVNVLSANLTNADRTPGSYNSIDFLSNGFKIRALNDGINKSGNEFIYMAFAEHPFVGDGTNPVTAR
jgi:Tfp pilus assembly major pilin PilA